MALTFAIRELADVYGDPFGHYRHHLVIIGEVAEGELHYGASVFLPLQGGGQVTSTVLGWWPSFSTPATLGVSLRGPAVPSELVALGIAREAPDESRTDHHRATLSDATARLALLHEMKVAPGDLRYHGYDEADRPFPCGRCLGAVTALADAPALLQAALGDTRAGVVAAAVRGLGGCAGDAALEALLPLAAHGSAGVRAEVARVLVKRPGVRGRSAALERLAEDVWARVREIARAKGPA